VYIVLLGDECSVDFLESREAKVKLKEVKKISRIDEGLHFLVKQN